MNKIGNINHIDYLLTTMRVARFTGSDSVFAKNQSYAESLYSKYLALRIKNPTKAEITMQYRLNEPPLACSSDSMVKNIAELEKIAPLKFLKKMGDSIVENLYPQTASLRDKLIKNNRFHISEVNPKMSQFQKFLFRLAK